MTLDMNALQTPKRGEVWNNGRGRRVKILSTTPAHAPHSATVTYKGIETLFKHTKTQWVRLDDFCKRFQLETQE